MSTSTPTTRPKAKAKAGKKPSKMASKLPHAQKVYQRWFRDMYLMRKFEERCGQLYIQQKFGGFCHLYIGQEAILAGISEAIRPTDRMVTAYRDHAHPLVLGTDPKFVMAELYGRKTGTSKGKGGSMHMFDKERNLFGGHGIVGGQIGLGAGIAFADKYRKEDHVTLCFMGDGAARQGILHETFNMAMTWKLPVIFIIENNKYAMGTSVERTSNVTDLETLGASYRMPSFTVDGMSPEAVHNYGPSVMRGINQGTLRPEQNQNKSQNVDNSSVNITVNVSSDGNVTQSQDSPKEFAKKVKSAVMQVINNEKRVGGSLRG